MGISKCQNRARHCVYWAGINSDIKCLIESCPTCQHHHHPQEPQQLLQPTLAPEHFCVILISIVLFIGSSLRSALYFIFLFISQLMASPQHWQLPVLQIWIPGCHRLLQDAHHQRNPCISMQWLQDHLSPEGTLCRMWHPRGTPYWQWPSVC